MHESSFEKARIFLEQYKSEMPSDRPIKVLEVGSKSYHDQDTYRGLFPSPEYIYTGLDIEAGNNVDIVPANPFIWDEIATSSFDFCVSGQTFEHNPYFWVTFAEISRVLLPGGLTLIIAPGAGPVHRYPVDCWRFYPDSWAALCTLTEMELVECYFRPTRCQQSQEVSGGTAAFLHANRTSAKLNWRGPTNVWKNWWHCSATNMSVLFNRISRRARASRPTGRKWQENRL